MPLKSKDFKEMFGQEMVRFALTADVRDFANIKVPAEANPVKGEKTKVAGRQGGKPPVDYTAVEMLVDMQRLLVEHRWRQAYRTYIDLKRITNT